MYADDSTLGANVGTLDVIEQKRKRDICNIVNWCDDDRMAINYNKAKAILITTCQKLHTLPVNELNITVKGKVLENVRQEKLLGLVVDQNISWNSHITKVHKTVSILLANFRINMESVQSQSPQYGPLIRVGKHHHMLLDLPDLNAAG